MPIIRIEADASRLAAYGVSTAEVATALRLNRVSATPDFGSTDTSKLVIWPLIDRVNVEALGDIVLKLVAGSPVRLRDVAVVRLDAKDDGIVARFDGKAAIVAEVQKRPETDIVAATRAVRQRVADLEVQRPASIRIDAGYLCERCAEPAKH
jgi:multidrug efflux pump subunit AcrB